MDFNYESPITKIEQEIASQIVETEEKELTYEVKKAIGYSIEKEELIKALQYDREQYEKGYNDGYNANKWIPVTYRELDEENERQLYPNADYIYNCNLPDDGQEVLITTKYRQVVMTTFYNDGDDGCYFECYEDWDDVLAWMPLPKPYKVESEEQNGSV